MTLQDIIRKLDLEVVTCGEKIDQNVSGGYCSDLLSFVMAKGAKGSIWVTLQSHPNIVAVAALVDLAAVIVTENVEIEQETFEKAKREEIVILRTPATSYEIVGKLYQIGVKSV